MVIGLQKIHQKSVWSYFIGPDSGQTKTHVGEVLSSAKMHMNWVLNTFALSNIRLEGFAIFPKVKTENPKSYNSVYTAKVVRDGK